MANTTNKPKSTKTSNAKKSSASTTQAKKTDASQKINDSKLQNHTYLLSLILVGVVLVLVLSSFSLYKVSQVEDKVTRVDDFFAANAQGYGNAESGTQTQEQQQGTQGTQGAPDTQQVEQPDIENRPMMGDPDAPITIVEYSDFECPFCQRYFQQTYPTLKEEYIDTGKVNLVYKDFPLNNIHPLAEPAAIASKCVFKLSGSDETFFEYHDTIFNNQNVLSESNLKKWALDVGVSESNYETCIENPEIASQVQADLEEGTQLGVTGTPSFVIDGELLVGAQPISAFRDVIDSKLEE